MAWEAGPHVCHLEELLLVASGTRTRRGFDVLEPRVVMCEGPLVGARVVAVLITIPLGKLIMGPIVIIIIVVVIVVVIII